MQSETVAGGLSAEKTKPSILLQLDTDPQPSVFDSVVAIDAGVEQLFRHGGTTPENARDRVHGLIFTRGPADLRRSAIFIGGSNVAAGEAVLERVRKSFLGPLRVSVLLDSNGANTTASAAVLAAARHVPLAGAKAVVLGATGPVGARVSRLLAREGAQVRAGSRDLRRADDVCRAVSASVPAAKIQPFASADPGDVSTALADAAIVIAAGAAGVMLLSESARRQAASLKVAIDLNAVPPVGLEGVEVMDKGVDRHGVVCYGAIGVGGAKMKIHRAAITRLFSSNDQILDAEELLEIGKSLG